MRNRVPGTLLIATVALAFFAATATADIVDLSNGVRLPKKKSITSKWGEFPKDTELRASGKNNLKLAYDAFEIDGKRADAAQLASVFVTTALLENQNFAAGEQHGVRGYWKEAVEAFRAAAQDLTGAAKQVALYKAMAAAINTGEPNLTLTVANELLDSDAKTYYFGPAHETRARVFATAGRLPNAVAALKLVTDAPGMNARDYFNAAYLSAWLTKFIKADSAEDYAAAEKVFRDLLRELQGNPRRELAQVPKLKIMMSLAASVRAQGRSAEATKIFTDILNETTRKTDKSVLAGVYYGMGDVAFEEASALQAKIKANPKIRDEVKVALEKAALHYLRVTLLYKEYAGQRELFGSTRGVARVFRRIFEVGGEKDCELARKAYAHYVRAVQMQSRGEERRLLVGEGKSLKERINMLCKDAEEKTDEK